MSFIDISPVSHQSLIRRDRCYSTVGNLDKVSLWFDRFEPEANVFSSVEQYVIMIAASIPIIVPALRWTGEKLLGYRRVIASWIALNKKTETAEYGLSYQPGQRSSNKAPDTQSEEYILQEYVLDRGKDLEAGRTSRDTE